MLQSGAQVLVPQISRDCLVVHTCLQQPGCGGLTEVMDAQSYQSCLLDRWGPYARMEVSVGEPLSVRTDKERLVGICGRATCVP